MACVRVCVAFGLAALAAPPSRAVAAPSSNAVTAPARAAATPSSRAVAAAPSNAGRASGPSSAPFWQDAPHARATANGGASFVDLAERARPAVVHVRGTFSDEGPPGTRGSPRQGVSIGTGFFIERSGFLVTNEHVVHGASTIRVRLYDGHERAACVVGADELTDIALLRAEGPSPVPVLALGDSDAVRVGEAAIVIGNPFGFNHSVTAGIVSAKERVIERSAVHRDNAEASDGYSFFLQTDASINLGNSGGPLLDARGAVIGVASAFWGNQQPAQGIAFAIPVAIVKALLPRLRADGTAPRSYLGVESQAIDPLLAEALALPSTRGALVASVEGGSAAADAAFDPGDVVTSWDGHALAGVEDFKIYAQLTPPETRVRVGLLRDGHALVRTVTTRAAPTRPSSPHPARCQDARASIALPLGLDVADVPLPDGVPADRASPGGRMVVVRRVDAGAGRDAGLLVGDRLVRVGARLVGTVAELERAVAAVPGDRPIPILVRRDGADFWAALARR